MKSKNRHKVQKTLLGIPSKTPSPSPRTRPALETHSSSCSNIRCVDHSPACNFQRTSHFARSLSALLRFSSALLIAQDDHTAAIGTMRFVFVVLVEAATDHPANSDLFRVCMFPLQLASLTRCTEPTRPRVPRSSLQSLVSQ